MGLRSCPWLVRGLEWPHPGTLPGSVCLLQLVQLDLARNRLEELPEKIGRLQNLRCLQLHSHHVQHRFHGLTTYTRTSLQKALMLHQAWMPLWHFSGGHCNYRTVMNCKLFNNYTAYTDTVNCHNSYTHICYTGSVPQLLISELSWIREPEVHLGQSVAGLVETSPNKRRVR